MAKNMSEKLLLGIEHEALMSTFTDEARGRRQLLAAFLFFFWADKKMSYADCLSCASHALVMVAIEDEKNRIDAKDEVARSLRIARLMDEICASKQ